MKLHLVRHAKTLQPEPNERDFDRHLMEKGKRQAQALGSYLFKHHVFCDVWCSEANRTVETLEILKEKCQFKTISYFRELYLCPKETFLDKMWKDTSKEDLLIVGHNYGISDVASYFTDEYIDLRTGEYICIDFGDYGRNESSKGLGKTLDRWRYSSMDALEAN